MKKLLLLGSFCLFSTAALLAQSCGTPMLNEFQQARLIAHQRMIARDGIPQRRETQYLPITFHMIANSAGEGRVDVRDVLSMLCYLNQEFADLDVQFYISGLNSFDNNGAYNTPGSSNARLEFERDDNAINIYIANAADTNGGVGLTLAYYSPQRDWIVTRKDQIVSNNNTLAHELGHFFSLPHPHNGWDAEPYNEDDHGVQVGAFSPGGVPNEKQDGSNCETAGDFICDTPPDYNFGFGWPDCSFDDEVLDPNGDVVNPEELLHMGYFLNCNSASDYFFSPDQQDLMLTDIASSERNYLDNSFSPGATEFDAPTPLSPTNGQILDAYNSVELKWEAVDGADFYLLRVSPFITLNASVNTIVYGTSKILTDLDPVDTYYWSVKPLNAYGVCHNTRSPTRNFTTGATVAVEEVAELTAWTVQPNPASTGEAVLITIDAARAFEATLQLSDLSGRAVARTQALRLSAGKQIHQIDTNGLSAGVYLLTLRDERGVSRKRIVVQ